MKRKITSYTALSLVATMLLTSISVPVTATAETQEATQQEVQAINDKDAPALLITEIATDAVSSSGTKLDFVEVYNNSNQNIDFMEYSTFYVNKNGTYREFSKDLLTSGQSTHEVDFGNKEELIIEPGKTLVIGFSRTDDASAEATTTETLVKAFNDYYGTNLSAYENFIRYNANNLYTASEKGFFIGKSYDSVATKAWINEGGDDITSNTDEKLAIQYAYQGNGKECEKTEVGAATPGSVEAGQVPAARVDIAEDTENLTINGAEASQNTEGAVEVSASVPHAGTASDLTVKVSYRQNVGDSLEQEYYDYNEIEMTPDEDGKTFTATIEGDQLFGDSVTWKVSATYGDKVSTDNGTEVLVKETEETTTPITITESTAKDDCPLIITEIGMSPVLVAGVSTGNGRRNQFCYIEVYNQSNEPVSATYFKGLYHQSHDDYAEDNSVCDISASSNGIAMIEPGQTWVYWISCNWDYTTLDMFNQHYGTNLEEGKDILDYSNFIWYGKGYKPSYGEEYMRVFDALNYGEVQLGFSKDSTVAGVKFNYTPESMVTNERYTEAGYTAYQYTYPRGNSDESILVSVSKATPGTVEDWQIPSQQKDCSEFEYPGTPKPSGDNWTPTLKECEIGDLQTPESINEGEFLKVMYDTDILMGSVSEEYLEAFEANDVQEHCGGTKELAENPFVLYYELYYKLDDAQDWTVVQERLNWHVGHYSAQIPSDVLFGHDKVTYKVRSYTLYGYAETEEKTVKINRINDTDEEVRLNVKDGDILSGANMITANDGAENTATEIYVDNQKVEITNVLEDGAYFAVNTTASSWGYNKNVITAPYGDNERDIVDHMNVWCEEPSSRVVHIDGKYFNYNEETKSYDVTLSMWCGNSGTPFEDVYGDYVTDGRTTYNVSGLQLRLANGKCYNPTQIGENVVGEDYSLENSYAVDGTNMHLDISFSVPESEVNAVGTTLDTTTLTDGKHTVTATSGEKTTTANIIVDNKKPEINVNAAEDGAVQYEKIPLAVDSVITDENGIEDIVATLDGMELTLPTTIVPSKLSVGEHKLAIAATDVAGNTETKEYTFSTEEVTPEITETASNKITHINAELSVTLGEEKSDVTFYEGRSLTKDNGGVVYGDVVTGKNGDFTYQTFSVEVGEINTDDMLAVRWNGTASGVDENHPITLFAANGQGDWEAVGEADSEGKIDLTIPAATYVKDGKATLLVQSCTKGTKPEINVTAAQEKIAEAQEETVWDGTGRPENYDFALAWETDTQYYTESFPQHYRNMNQWIVDNAEKWKISYVLHTGDIVDDSDMAGEWIVADEAMKIFDDADMPYGVLGGNHDVYGGSEKYGFYWQYFGEDRFKDKDYYGGSYKNNLGHYDLITENGQDFIIVYMSWDIYQDEIDWMNEVLAKYSDRKAILAFHRYANVSKSTYNGKDSLLDYAGKVIQKEVVEKNPNVFAVLNGHYHGSTMQTTAFDDDGDGIKERQVYEICTDYQSDPEGGSEYIKFLYFDIANNKIYLNSYSPYRDDFNYYDTKKQESYGADTLYLSQDIAEWDVALNGAERTLSTDTMYVDVQTTKEIGKLTDVSGEVTYQWTGLESQTAYGWYANITNSRNGQKATEVKGFETAEKTYRKVVTAATAGGNITGDTEVEYGSSVTYTFTPDTGYKVLQVLVDGALVDVNGNTYTIENITEDHTIEVTFTKEESNYVPDAPEQNTQNNRNEQNTQNNQNEQNSQNNVGTVVTVGKIKYTITNNKDNAGTVSVTKTDNNSATSVKIPATITIDSNIYKVTEIGEKAFEGSKKLKTINIGKNVTTIGKSAFKNCTALTTIKGGSGLVTIGSNSFYGCKALKKLTLSSKSLKKINTSAFSKCTALTTVSISSKKLTTIGKKAFYGDKKLKSIILKTTKLAKSKVGTNAFKGIKSNCKFKVPSSKVKSYKKIFTSKGAGSKITVTK